MNPQIEFLQYLRHERNLMACDEVSHYGCRADVLAIDKNKGHVIEYEFKNNSNDLKNAEKKKSKYGTHKRRYKKKWFPDEWRDGKYKRGVSTLVTVPAKIPHRFYFVVSQELWEKETEYLEKQYCGVIMYTVRKHTFGDPRKKKQTIEIWDFTTVKKCRTRKANLQDYDVAIKNILTRLSNAYVCLLMRRGFGKL